jgi:hypothetical protein
MFKQIAGRAVTASDIGTSMRFLVHEPAHHDIALVEVSADQAFRTRFSTGMFELRFKPGWERDPQRYLDHFFQRAFDAVFDCRARNPFEAN